MIATISGGVTTAKGFRAAGIHCGIRKNREKPDLAMIAAETTCAAAAIYTQNLVKGAPIYTTNIPSQAVQDQFYILGGGRLPFGLPYSVIIMLVYGVILGIILAKTRVGRQIYACGSNLEAAKLSGINAVRTRMFAYCVSGFSAAICGILVASRVSSAQPTAGTGYELEAIAAAVLGGVSNNGGEGNILNTIIGALIMGVLRNGLNLNGVNSFWQQVIIGVILVGACAMEARRQRQAR